MTKGWWRPCCVSLWDRALLSAGVAMKRIYHRFLCALPPLSNIPTLLVVGGGWWRGVRENSNFDGGRVSYGFATLRAVV